MKRQRSHGPLPGLFAAPVAGPVSADPGLGSAAFVAAVADDVEGLSPDLDGDALAAPPAPHLSLASAEGSRCDSIIRT